MRKRILIVDDDQTEIILYQLILQEEGYIVETAMTGLQALDVVRKTGFHLVIINTKLPDLTGEEVAKELQKTEDKIGIVLLTDYASFEDCIDSLDMGIDEILVKPVKPSELLDVAKEVIQKHGEIPAIA